MQSWLFYCHLLHLRRSTRSSAMAAAFVIAARPSPALGLPKLGLARAEGLRCGCGKKPSSALAPVVAKGVPLLAAASATAASAAPMLASALALVDERMSREATTGLSSDLLGWFLLVSLGLVLCFYTVYSSTFDDDDDDYYSGGGGITL